MRGFAVAAGGWDEETAAEAVPPLRLVEPATDAHLREDRDLDAPSAEVVALDARREREEADAARETTLIYAW